MPSEHRHWFEEHRNRLEGDGLVVHLPGVSQPLRISLSPSFWRNCPEVRSAVIDRWMHSRGEAPWKKGRPPQYRAFLIVGQEIELRLEG